MIFDEVVTFPVAYGGAQAHYGVTPDLTTMSKAIGGGLPMSAIGGRADIMNLMDPDLYGGKAPVTSVSTYACNQLSLAAGIAAIRLLTPQVHARLSAIGDRARAGIDAPRASVRDFQPYYDGSPRTHLQRLDQNANLWGPNPVLEQLDFTSISAVQYPTRH